MQRHLVGIGQQKEASHTINIPLVAIPFNDLTSPYNPYDSKEFRLNVYATHKPASARKK
jgi:hypothetical protein